MIISLIAICLVNYEIINCFIDKDFNLTPLRFDYKKELTSKLQEQLYYGSFVLKILITRVVDVVVL